MALGVGVHAPVVAREDELVRVVHAEEAGGAVDGVDGWFGQGHALRDVCEGVDDVGGVDGVFEEGAEGGAREGGFGVCDDGLEGVVELVEELDGGQGVAFAVGHAVVA